MFRKILVANRGEIAVRIIHACQEMGIETVAVYSTADADALHTQLADEAICIGPPKANASYLNIPEIISAAGVTHAEAIHPGFGFLSENSRFAEICEASGIKFIGPDAETIDLMGDKVHARKLMQHAGVPVIPGSDGEIHSADEAEIIAQSVGYPVMLKASAGGGGKGIRQVAAAKDLKEAFQSAQKEALAAFGNGAMYLEKVIYPARHIEVQILADAEGHVVHLGERDCSLQRNHQKMIEEAPAIFVDEKTRLALGAAAVDAAKAAGYENAGTVEFLLDPAGHFYFMEMNTRIQVEHPVTEMITGIDLVKSQIRIAAGEKLAWRQEDIHFSGHAIECRINAENPLFHFAPMPGKIENLLLPSGGLGLRVDSAMYSGYTIPPFYDSMIAKIIVLGTDRGEAIMKMQRALNELVTEGVTTNREFQLDLLMHPEFMQGNYDTSFIAETFLPEWEEENKTAES